LLRVLVVLGLNATLKLIRPSSSSSSSIVCRNMGLARPILLCVRPSVCHLLRPFNSERKRRGKTKIGL